eukprot:Skav202776  [mRNA]  locus=scaffold326:329563:334590:- [translate_table: standard]
MPGRWVGGRGSQACPLKDQFFEGKTIDDERNDQGTVLVRVKRIYSPGEKGRFLLGDYVAASDKAHRDWASSKMGRPSTIDGSYHLCRAGPEKCTASNQHDIVVHVGQWRLWKEDELMAGGPDHFPREARNLVQAYFKKHDLKAGKGTEEDLPWPGTGRQGVLKIGRDPSDVPKAKGGETGKGEKENPKGDSKREKVAQLKEQLRELKKELRADEQKGKATSGGEKRKRDDSAKKDGSKKKKKKKTPFDEGGLGQESVDWGTDGEPMDEESEESEDSEGSDPTTSPEKDRKKKVKKRSKSKKKKGSRKTKKKDGKRSRRGSKAKRRDSQKSEQDKGPFGVGETRRLPKVGSEESSDDESSGDSERSFRKAPSGLTLHLRLQRYAQRFPGRLATRLLQKMERETRFEGAMVDLTGKRKVQVKACAVTYHLTILSPKLRDRWNLRSQREMRVLAEILDQLAVGRGSTAADIVAQRLKAPEQSIQDSNSWRKAKFLELVAEESTMADRGEENMMYREVELEEKYRTRPTYYPQKWEEYPQTKGKEGKGSGKQKGRGKGKPRTPAMEAAENKPKDGSGTCTELLPISLKALEGHKSWSTADGAWLSFICLVLNYQFCGGRTSKKFMVHANELNQKQMTMVVEHLLPAIGRLCGDEKKVPSPQEVMRDLTKKGHNYDGTSYVVMEEIDPDRVIACWPSPTEAAVAPLEEFLEGRTLELVKKPMETILPREEWPEKLPKSYVRASDEAWAKPVAEGYRRNLFQACPREEVLKDHHGNLVVNGAGAVEKIKGGVSQQRFISIFCPLNAISAKIEGDEATLPYVGQVHLLDVPSECEVVIDSEDMASAFNLFKMPEGWRGLFVYERQVPAHCLGLPGDAPTFVSLRIVPMGWLSAVGLVQAAIRHLAFSIAKLPGSSEVLKWQQLPKGDRLLLYLDSVDQLRIVSKVALRLVEGETSEEHRRFKEACESKGLPTNASKTLSGALEGSLQGGELRSRDGVFMLQGDKMRFNVAMCLAMLAKKEWTHAEAAGMVGRLVFATAFRRCMLATMCQLFTRVHGGARPSEPTQETRDELTMMMALMPLAFTNVKAPIYQKLSATDASPTGGGSCVAVQLKRGMGVPNPQILLCFTCRTEMGELIGAGEEFECPLGCGSRFCSLQCYLTHKEEWKSNGLEKHQEVRQARQRRQDLLPGAPIPQLPMVWEGGSRTGSKTWSPNGSVFQLLLWWLQEIFEGLNWPDCPHSTWGDYQPYFDDDGVIRYPTEEEAEYPLGLCQAYAQGLKAGLVAKGVWPNEQAFRQGQIAKQLEKYSRFEDPDLLQKVAARILDLEATLIEGQEDAAFAAMLRHGHYRGTDIRYAVEHNAQRELAPYPAYRWLWRETMSYKRKQDAHINELETQALVAHIRRLLKEPCVFKVKLMVIVDSQVLFYAVGKGRSPSLRLNRLLRRLAALALAGDLYVFPVWTLSAWNYANNPSRRV